MPVPSHDLVCNAICYGLFVFNYLRLERVVLFVYIDEFVYYHCLNFFFHEGQLTSINSIFGFGWCKQNVKRKISLYLKVTKHKLSTVFCFLFCFLWIYISPKTIISRILTKNNIHVLILIDCDFIKDCNAANYLQLASFQYVVYIWSLFSLYTCFLHVSHMFSSRFAHVFIPFHTCFHPVSHMFPSRFTHVSFPFHTCFLPVSHMFSSRFTHVFFTFHTCFIHVSHMFSSRFTHVFILCHTCFLPVSHMFSSRFTHVFFPFHTCFIS